MTVATLVALLRQAWRTHRVPLIVIGVAVGLFEFILTRVAPSPTRRASSAVLFSTLPPEVRSLIGNEVALSAGGFLAFGYVHPFFMLLLGVWVVRTSSAAIAGEIGRGTMDLLATRPVSRWHFVAAGLTTLGLGLGLILAAALTAPRLVCVCDRSAFRSRRSCQSRARPGCSSLPGGPWVWQSARPGEPAVKPFH